MPWYFPRWVVYDDNGFAYADSLHVHQSEDYSLPDPGYYPTLLITNGEGTVLSLKGVTIRVIELHRTIGISWAGVKAISRTEAAVTELLRED